MRQAIEREALDVFAAWLDWPHDVRDAQLAALLEMRPDLFDQVRNMIASNARAELIPTQPPAPFETAAQSSMPERVGLYRLTGLIGRGGMGMVFRAERDDGLFTQSVAIKLIRRGLFAAQAAVQFGRERQILARLRHPHIAQLFDGGVTGDGDPYIVMELIEGESIIDHCGAAGVDLTGRMALMRDVCGAVQFAHQSLIVHADIKPSNVIVDPRYGVKLLDFGIARLLDAADRVDAGADAAHTPAYASPARLAGLPATPADDLFSLGKLAGELIAGGPPPPRELAAVIDRATAPDPAARYGAASALADDLGRWLAGQPVSALPSRRWRTARMFVRRHLVASAATVLALLSLIGAVVFTSVLYVRAESARLSAERRFAEVRQLSSYLLNDLTNALEAFPGTSAIRHDLAERGRTYLETLGRLPRPPQDVRLEIAHGYATTARILGAPGLQSLGDSAGAMRDLERAEAGLRSLRAEVGDTVDIDLALSQALVTQGEIAHVSNNDARLGERLFAQACAFADRAAAGHGITAAVALAQANCLMGLVNVYDYDGRFSLMPRPLDRIFSILNTAPAGGDVVDFALLRGNALILKGDADYFLGDHARGLADYRKAAEALRTGGPLTPADPRLLERAAWADYSIASTLSEMNRFAEALDSVDRGVAAADLMLFFEKSPRAWHMDEILHMQRAVTLGSLHRQGEAIAEGDAALRAFQAVAARNPADFEAARSVPVNMRPLGEIYWAAGRREEACAIFARTSDLWAQLARRRGVTGFDASDELKLLQRLINRCEPIRR